MTIEKERQNCYLKEKYKECKPGILLPNHKTSQLHSPSEVIII